MDVSTIAVIIMGLIQCMFIGAVVTFIVMSRKDDDSNGDCVEGDEHVALLWQRVKTLQEENYSLHDHVREWKIVAEELQAEHLHAESVIGDSPLPTWLKDEHGVMVFVNKAYEELFLLPVGKTAVDYVGKTDYEVWDVDVASQFREHDVFVMSTGGVFNSTEKFPVNGVMEEWRIVKYPHYVNGELAGVAGKALPPKHVELLAFPPKKGSPQSTGG